MVKNTKKRCRGVHTNEAISVVLFNDVGVALL